GSIATAGIMSAGDYLYMQCWDDDIYVVRRRSGHLAARVHLDHRLSLDAARAREYLYVAPFTEGSVVALSLPGLTLAGRFNLDAPGGWVTTPPVRAGGGGAGAGGGGGGNRGPGGERAPPRRRGRSRGPPSEKGPGGPPRRPPTAEPRRVARDPAWSRCGLRRVRQPRSRRRARIASPA